ncbi:cold shock domain-containing protein [Pedobacter psychrodurus]|uniref:cold shock domain-containing protein n=1 Tax=Pedobacter psychrodurus TaxID=2530456 RepID=UPI00292E709A|nr:cold shock domain-containing protein [Pedobacter psychrodurus]
MNNKRKGYVSLIDIEQGHGIIIDENGQDIHFFLSTTSDHMITNSKVNFEIELSTKGLTAVNVELEIDMVRV